MSKLIQRKVFSVGSGMTFHISRNVFEVKSWIIVCRRTPVTDVQWQCSFIHPSCIRLSFTNPLSLLVLHALMHWCFIVSLLFNWANRVTKSPKRLMNRCRSDGETCNDLLSSNHRYIWLCARKCDINGTFYIFGNSSLIYLQWWCLFFALILVAPHVFIVPIPSLPRLLDNKEINLQSVHWWRHIGLI